jgi:hypothetical protein
MRWPPLSLLVSFAVLAGFHPEVAKAQQRPSMQDILDLKRIAANPEMVIPLRPDESELWVLVQRDEMPPSDSPRGPLTPAQKEIIRTWITAGAPDVADSAIDFTTSFQSEPFAKTLSEMASVDRLLRWLGKFHLLMLHFPIALILVAGIGEAWSIWKRNPIPPKSLRFCLCMGAIAAVPTAGLGWLFAAAGNGVDSPQLLMFHRWLGTTTAVWLVLTAVYAEREARRGLRSWRVRLLVMCGLVITALTAHLGGLLAHGGDYFTY